MSDIGQQLVGAAGNAASAFANFQGIIEKAVAELKEAEEGTTEEGALPEDGDPVDADALPEEETDAEAAGDTPEGEEETPEEAATGEEEAVDPVMEAITRLEATLAQHGNALDRLAGRIATLERNARSPRMLPGDLVNGNGPS